MNIASWLLSTMIMKKTFLIVPWAQGLHMRPAAKLVRLAQSYRSSIHIRCHSKMADAKSIINVLLLCAVFGTLLEVEISGEDEIGAAAAIEQLFELRGDDNDAGRLIGDRLGDHSNINH